MKKNIFKEILITLLIVVAVVLVLAVVFYQYIPSNRVIPSKVTAYQASEEVSKEIDEQENAELMEQQRTYEITDADLSMYKQNDSYRPGKVDPFAAASSSTVEGGSSETPSTSNPSSGGSTGEAQPTPQPEEKDKNTTNNYYTASGLGGSTK